MISELTPVIDAWEQTARSTTDLCATLLDSDWNRATECPGWSVRDVVSHIIGVERELLGELPPWHQLPRDLLHVRDDAARHREVPVDLRRCHTAPEMMAELREVVDRRTAMLRSDQRRLDEEVEGLMGVKAPYRDVLTERIFDVWAHEQDIRRAVGSPGNLDGAAADVARDVLTERLADVVAEGARVPTGSTVVFEVSGPTSFTRVLRVDASGHGTMHEGVVLAPTATLRMDWETFVRLTCGRARAASVDAKADGDAELAHRVLEHMAVTA